MTFLAFSTYVPWGSASGNTASQSNAATVTAGAKSPLAQDTYGHSLVYDGNILGSQQEGQYARYMTWSTAGVIETLNTNTPYIEFWIRFHTLGVDHEFLTWSTSQVVNATTGRFASLRIRSDGKIRFHDTDTLGDDLDNTAFDTGAVALSASSWYRILASINVTTGAYEILVYDTTGTLIDTIDGTGADLGATVCEAIMLGCAQGAWYWANAAENGGLGNSITASPCTYYVGNVFVDNAEYPSKYLRTGIIIPGGDSATHTGWTLAAGASKHAALATIPPDGNTTYIRSTSADEAYTATMAASTLDCRVVAFSPFVHVWDEGGAVTITTRFIENSTTTDGSAASDPGANVDFHRRGRMFLTMPSDASAPTIAKLVASEVGLFRDAGTTAVRCGSAAITVIYMNAPAPTSAEILADGQHIELIWTGDYTGATHLLTNSLTIDATRSGGAIQRTAAWHSIRSATIERIIVRYRIAVAANAILSTDTSVTVTGLSEGEFGSETIITGAVTNLATTNSSGIASLAVVQPRGRARARSRRF